MVLHTLIGNSYILVGDIGGTNTRLKIFEVQKHEKMTDDNKPPGKLFKHKEYSNSDFDSFTDVVRTFLSAEPVTDNPPVAGCLAVDVSAQLGPRRRTGVRARVHA